MRAFDFSVELRTARFDVCVAYTLVLDMPVEFGLELMTVVSSDLLDTERELFNDVIDKVDGVGLRVPSVNFQCSHACCIINRSILVALDLLPVFFIEDHELDVHLDVVARPLFVVTPGVNLPHASAARQAAQAMALERAIDAGI